MNQDGLLLMAESVFERNHADGNGWRYCVAPDL